MLINIVDFKAEHLENMDMREHEAKQPIDAQLLLGSLESKTALLDNKVICCWGIMEDGGIWQIPSKWIEGNGMFYARRAIKVVREMIKDKPYIYSFCLDDEFHNRWMRFIGLKPNYDKSFKIGGNDFLLYERVGNGA